MVLVFILLLISNLFWFTESSGIEEYPLDKFPAKLDALHFGCPESEVFATNCACHVRCRGANCANARNLCVKYSQSHNCKYILMRGSAPKMIATLKRAPWANESNSFDISGYPKTMEELMASPIWKDRQSKKVVNSSAIPKRMHMRDLVQVAGSRGQTIIDKLQDPQFNGKNRFCGEVAAKNESWTAEFLKQGISLVALHYKAPKSFLNSLTTWDSSGLLDLVTEKKVLMNAPSPTNLAIAADYKFEIIQPRDIPDVKVSKPNVMTIGAAFYYALTYAMSSDSEYLLFLEDDFKMNTDLSREDIAAQLIAAAGMLERDVPIVRLQSRKAKGCGTFKACGHAFRPTGKDRNRNWYSFYCKDHKQTGNLVQDCFDEPSFRCFTSWESNWSLNAVLVKKSSILNKQYNTGKDGWKTIPEIGLQNWKDQAGFESQMGFGYKWMNWRVPVCISYEGMFIHYEIETST